MDACHSCGSPLAADQRYCIRCGARRPDARLSFLDVLEDDRSAPAPTAAFALPAAPAEPRLRDRVEANGPWIGLGAILVGTLLAGLLLGHWAGGSTTAATPAAAPQVIKLEAAPAAAAATTAAAPADAGAVTTASDAADDAKTKKKKAAAAEVATPPKDAVDVKSLTDKKALEKAVKKGKPISTGTGKLPPKDDKPAGGGSAFEEIG